MKIPNVSPKIFTLSAVIVGYLLIDDMTSSEQNALGNWLMLVAQVLCTNAYYREVKEERNKLDNNYDSNEIIIILQKMRNALDNEINNLKG